MNDLIVKAKARWVQLTPKDQLMLSVGGLCVLIYLLYMLILSPLYEIRDQQWQVANASAESLAKVRTLAATWMSRNKQGADGENKGSLVELVDSSLRKNQLRLSGLQPSGSDSVRLRLENANFDNLLAWLYQMEVDEGLQVRDISVAPGNQPGAVAANLRLQRL